MGRRVARHRSNFVKKSGASEEFMREMIESPEDFEFSVIETTKTESEARERERFWISFYQSTNPQFGYNRSATTDKASGFKWTKEAIARRTATSMKNGARRKPVEMLSMAGDVIKKFPSQGDAAKFVGKQHSKISGACNGKSKSAFGYKWRFA